MTNASRPVRESGPARSMPLFAERPDQSWAKTVLLRR